MDLGLERAGFQVKWQVEIDEYASKVLAKHWPDVARFRDVRDCGSNNLETVDLIAGGFPCQDISFSGKGRGLSGERSGLWYEFARIIRELRPKYVLVENVSALLHRGFGNILTTLASFGYDAEWSVLSACALGAPHTRERLFIIAYPNGKHGEEGMALFHDIKTSLSASYNHKSITVWSAPPPPELFEWLMGFPQGWTDVEDLEMPSSHKLLSTSEDAS